MRPDVSLLGIVLALAAVLSSFLWSALISELSPMLAWSDVE
jgi:hypothetical protein